MTRRAAPSLRESRPASTACRGGADRGKTGPAPALFDDAGIHHGHAVGGLGDDTERCGIGSTDRLKRCCRSRAGQDLRLDESKRAVAASQQGLHTSAERDSARAGGPAGELMRIFARALRLGNADRFAARWRVPARRRPRATPCTCSDPQSVADGEHRVERGHRLLEDERDLRAADSSASPARRAPSGRALNRSYPAAMRPGAAPAAGSTAPSPTCRCRTRRRGRASLPR